MTYMSDERTKLRAFFDCVPDGPFRALVRRSEDGETVDCLIDVGVCDFQYRVLQVADIADQSKRSLLDSWIRPGAKVDMRPPRLCCPEHD